MTAADTDLFDLSAILAAHRAGEPVEDLLPTDLPEREWKWAALALEASLVLDHEVDDLPVEVSPRSILHAARRDGLARRDMHEVGLIESRDYVATEKVRTGREDELGREIIEERELDPAPEAVLAVRCGPAALSILADEPRSRWDSIVKRYFSDLDGKAAKRIASATVAPPDVASLLHVPGELTAHEGAPRPIVDGLLLSNQTILFTAPPKLGKSYLRSALTRSLIDGTPFYGRPVEQVSGRVVIVDLEMHSSEADEYLRVHGLEGRDEVRLAALQGRQRDFDVLNEAVLDRWIETLNAVDAQVLIVDTTTAAFSASDVNPLQGIEVKKWLQRVEEIRLRSSVTEILLIGHSTKDGKTPGGAVELQGGVDGVWTMTVGRGGSRRLRATIRTATGATITLPPAPRGSEEAVPELSMLASKVLAELRSRGGEESIRKLREAVGANARNADAAVEELAQKGSVVLLDTPRGRRLKTR